MTTRRFGFLVLGGAICAASFHAGVGDSEPLGLMVSPSATNEAVPQGGDTFADAYLIESLPFEDDGTTVGFHDNYDETCPTESFAPDVCYKYTPESAVVVTVDLCGSAFDTKLYVRNDMNETVACNDEYYMTGDPCGLYVSRIDEVVLPVGRTYYIVVDGYGGAGQYHLEVRALTVCDLAISGDAVLEGEPEIVDGYVDQYNGGCSSPQFGYPVQILEGNEAGQLTLAGKTGWYNSAHNRDIDVFRVTVGGNGVVRIALEPEYWTVVWVYREFDCADPAGYEAFFRADRCQRDELMVYGPAGSPIWLFVMPWQWTYPYGMTGHEYDYLLTFEGLQSGDVRVERTTWGRRKATFRETR